MKSFLFNPVLLLMLILSASSCNPVVDYPDEPVISFTSVDVRDSVDALDNTIKRVTITFHLTDGNGDIGLGTSDTTGVFHQDSLYYNNLFIREFEKIDGEFVAVPEPVGLKKYRIPDITPSGQNKTLIADISVSLEYPYSGSTPLPFSEFCYQFYVVDRELNISNTDTTSVIVW
ncbi:MAG: hypothetical protein V2A67_02835 [Bacteroidota bacterium]